MKRKVLVGSLLSALMSLSVFIGSTFALFTSKAETNIAISSGKVEVVAEAKLVATSSMDVPQELGKFANGGTAEVDGSKVILNLLTPGDKADFTITVKNNSNVDAKYRTIVSLVSGVELFSGLKVTIDGNAYDGFAKFSSWSTLDKDFIDEVQVSVELPSTAGDEYQNLNTQLIYTVEAVQGNATVEDHDANTTYIYNANDLRLVAKSINEGTYDHSKAIKLMSDIDLTGSEWTPIDLWGKNLVIDGNNKVIKNMYVTGGDNIGFISRTSGTVTISNLKFVDSVVNSTSSRPATVIAAQYGTVTLSNVDVENGVVVANIKNKGIRPGGLIAQSYLHDGAKLYISDCDVTKTSVSGYHNVGGLVGSLMEYTTLEDRFLLENNTVTDCTFSVGHTNENYASAYTVDGGKFPAKDVNDAYFEAKGNSQSGNIFSYGDFYNINTVEDLYAFAAAVNSGEEYKGITVKLMANLDLGDAEFPGIGSVDGYWFKGTFEGNGYTISNFSVNKNSYAGLFGKVFDSAIVRNVIVDNANISGNHWAGGIAAYSYGIIENCKVTNSTISLKTELVNNEYDNGDKAGGIVGYLISTTSGAKVIDNTIENVTVEAYRDLGGISGMSNIDASGNPVPVVTGNTIKNVNLKYSTENHYSTPRNENLNRFIGRNDAKVDTSSNIDKDIITNDAIKNLPMDNNGVVTLDTNTNVVWNTGASHGSTPFEFAEGAKEFVIDGNNDATFTAIGDGVGPIGSDKIPVVFKNITIVDLSESYAEGSWEFGYLEFRGTLVFENVTFESAIMISGVDAQFINCTFNSNKSNEYDVWVDNGNASFEGCTFLGYRGLKIHEDYGSDVGEVIVDDCTFGPLSVKPGIAIGTVDSTTIITIQNSKFVNTQPGDQGNYKYESDTDTTTFVFTDLNNEVI